MLAQTFYHRVEPYGHCATICPHKQGVLVAYYSGPECTDEQRIHIKYFEKGETKTENVLPKKTGNCVLIPTQPQKATLIFSYFTDTDGINKPRSPIERWIYCSNWKVLVGSTEEGIRFNNCEILGIEPVTGLLTRCSPIQIKEKWLLPLYREHNCYGQIIQSSDGWRWQSQGIIGGDRIEKSGRFGTGILIQPTIWEDGKTCYSLSRDITKNRRAWYSQSDDFGKTWSEPQTTQLWNSNNSLVAIQDKTAKPLLVWNHGVSRSILLLGRWDPNKLNARPFVKLNQGMASSYPNYCWDYKRNLHIVHSDSGPITHHILTQEALNLLEKEKDPEKVKLITDFKWWEVKDSLFLGRSSSRQFI